MTFLQLLLAVEEMQTQQRAENGIRERIVGYVGSDWIPEPEDINFAEAAMFGGMYETSVEELPEDIRDIVLAENHRMATGEVLTAAEFKKRKGGEKT